MATVHRRLAVRLEGRRRLPAVSHRLHRGRQRQWQVADGCRHRPLPVDRRRRVGCRSLRGGSNPRAGEDHLPRRRSHGRCVAAADEAPGKVWPARRLQPRLHRHRLVLPADLVGEPRPGRQAGARRADRRGPRAPHVGGGRQDPRRHQGPPPSPDRRDHQLRLRPHQHLLSAPRVLDSRGQSARRRRQLVCLRLWFRRRRRLARREGLGQGQPQSRGVDHPQVPGRAGA